VASGAGRGVRAGADSGLTSTDAIGVLAVDATGKLKEEEKAGARSTGKGAGIGAALFLLGPVAIGVGVLGAAAGGALRRKGLGLTDPDRERSGKELTNGKAAAGVLAPFNESAMISAKLGELGGASEEDTVSDEALKAASKPTSGSRRTAVGDAGPPGPSRPGGGRQCPARTVAAGSVPGRSSAAGIAAKPRAPHGKCW
jgi:hypothetical protein